jgi:hypothetical protein
MTSIEKCIEHWESVEKSRKEEIQEIIKELDKICITQPFNYSMFENRMHDLRRLRIEVEHIFWFTNSMENYKRLDNTWIDDNVLELPKQEISKNFSFDKDLENLINYYSMENESDTSDFILAKFMSECLVAFNNAVKNREQLKLKNNDTSSSK